MGTDVHEQISWKQGEERFDSLPVFPNPNRLIGGKKGLDLSQGEVPDQGLFVLRDGEHRAPFAVACTDFDSTIQIGIED
jgi:hypothetical protein